MPGRDEKWPRRPPIRVLSCHFVLLACLVVTVGSCSRSGSTKPRRQGAKVNLVDFRSHTTAYKGKSLSLLLKVDEPIDRSQGQSLRDYVGRDVKFTTTDPKGERLELVITIPDGLSVPDIGKSDEVTVTFVCTRGDLRQGNQARAVEAP